MLAETLRLARRRRQFRRVGPIAGVLVLMGLLAVFVAQHFSKPSVGSSPLAKNIARQSYEACPHAAAACRRNRQHAEFSAAGFTASVANVTEIATVSGGFRLINDDSFWRCWRTSRRLDPHRPAFGRVGFRQPGRPKEVIDLLTRGSASGENRRGANATDSDWASKLRTKPAAKTHLFVALQI